MRRIRRRAFLLLLSSFTLPCLFYWLSPSHHATTSSSLSSASSSSSSSFLAGTDTDLQAVSPVNKIALKKKQLIVEKNGSSFDDSMLSLAKVSQRDEVSQESTWTLQFPDIFIIGFGKSGTRALLDAFLFHPQIHGPPIEVRYFDHNYSQGMQWYMSKMPQPKEGVFIMEKSPSYIIGNVTISRMLETMQYLKINPSTRKFVVMVRDPITRSVSEYVEWRTRSILQHKPIKHILSMMYTSDRRINLSVPFVHASLYSSHVSKWLKYFPSSQMCFVDGERFVADPFSVMKSLESCLNLKPFYSQDHFVFVEERGFYCFRPDLQSRESVVCQNLSKGRHHPGLPDDTVRDLRNVFHPFNLQLCNITGETYSWLGC